MRATAMTASVLLILLSGGAPPAGSGDPPLAHRDHAEEPGDAPADVTRGQQGRSPRAVILRGQHRSVQVNVDAFGDNIVGDAANEPSLAVDPLDPSNLVIGWRQFDSVLSDFRQAGVGYSHDGGANWTFPGVLQPGQFRSDPVLAANADGVFYYYSLSSATAVEMNISAWVVELRL